MAVLRCAWCDSPVPSVLARPISRDRQHWACPRCATAGLPELVSPPAAALHVPPLLRELISEDRGG